MHTAGVATSRSIQPSASFSIDGLERGNWPRHDTWEEVEDKKVQLQVQRNYQTRHKNAHAYAVQNRRINKPSTIKFLTIAPFLSDFVEPQCKQTNASENDSACPPLCYPSPTARGTCMRAWRVGPASVRVSCLTSVNFRSGTRRYPICAFVHERGEHERPNNFYDFKTRKTWVGSISSMLIEQD